MEKPEIESAKQIILALVNAAMDGVLVQLQDSGEKVDVVLSRIPGQEHSVMGLDESERWLDKAIRAAYTAMTGLSIDGDPVEFINS